MMKYPPMPVPIRELEPDEGLVGTRYQRRKWKKDLEKENAKLRRENAELRAKVKGE